MNLSRRRFLESSAAASLAASAQAAEKIPHRNLGATGVRVSQLAFGCGSRLLSMKDKEKGIAALHRAHDLGITYFDSAFGYGNGQSETWVGEAMESRRKSIFLVTKLGDRSADDAMRTLEGSLKRLRTDHLDLIHMHSLTTMDDLAKIEAADGVLKLLYKLRDQKVTRFIGVSSHTDPVVLKTCLERHDLNVTQMALNGARMGNAKPSVAQPGDSFETVALPAALKKKMGVIAMKIFGQEKLNGKAPVDVLIRYSLSLPVSAVVIGMPQIAMLEQNVQIAANFKPLAPVEMKQWSDKLAAENKLALDLYFRDHIDA
jgi:hypothetical protein